MVVFEPAAMVAAIAAIIGGASSFLAPIGAHRNKLPRS